MLSAYKLLKRILIAIGALLPIALCILYYLFYVHITNGGLTFTNALHIPPILEPKIEDGTKIFDLTLQHGSQSFLINIETGTETMGFNGDYLGPTIRVRKGDNVRFNVSNQLDEVATVHWHGLHLPPEMDGGPHQKIEPGQVWQPYYPIMNEASLMWYHPHTHEETGHQVYYGLAGLYIIDDENSDSLALPKTYGVDDIPLIVQDRLFQADGTFDYQIAGGMFHGDTILINGTHNPIVEVPAKKVRFRLLNASNARIYNFGFSDDREFHQITTDGGFLEAPVPLTRLRLAPGERAEMVVDLSDGANVHLKSYPSADILSLFEDVFDDDAGNGHFELLKLAVQATDEVSPELPQTLNVIEGWEEAEADKIRPIRLGGPADPGQTTTGGGPDGAEPINGKFMDMARVDEVVTLDDVEIWEIINDSGGHHPFHIHDIQFLILDRNGQAPPPNERGWKDTVLVSEDETVRFITQFTTYANETVPFMYHCHIMEHEDNGMMGQFTVVEPSSDFKDSDGYLLSMEH